MMIHPVVLRTLVLTSLLEEPRTQYTSLMASVERLAKRHDVFPTEEQCREQNVPPSSYLSYYREKRLSPLELTKLNEIVWDLIVERFITIGRDSENEKWPFLRLTDLGQIVASSGATAAYYDPDGYVSQLDSLVQGLDPVIKQYAAEGVRAFRQNLLFASAVMLGAAAEKALLLLVESIANAEADQQKKRKLLQLLDSPRLPTIFQTVQTTIRRLSKAGTLPYAVHQGSTEHLLSLLEMVRVQRNEAVHPAAGAVNKEKVFLALQTIPAALARVYALIGWFKTNSI